MLTAGAGSIVRAMDLRVEVPGDRAAVRDVTLRAFGDEGTVVASLVDSHG
jgi:putative acetyltransferase